MILICVTIFVLEITMETTHLIGSHYSDFSTSAVNGKGEIVDNFQFSNEIDESLLSSLLLQ